jgi:hypothetical protein
MVDYIKLTPDMCNNWSRTFDQVNTQMPWASRRLVDATTASQAQSKLWLATELSEFKNEVNNVGILGGWFAHIITPLLIDEVGVKNIVNYEIDKDAITISVKFNRRVKKEIYSISNRNIIIESLPKRNMHDTIINTSCEHMFPMWKFRELNPHLENVLYVLQSTDDDQYDDHINCVSSADELAEQARLVDIYFSGSKVLDNEITRFMVIGK